LLSKLTVIAFAHMTERPFVIIDGLPYIIATFFDLNEALDITALTSDLPPFKLRFYSDVFVPAHRAKYVSLLSASSSQQQTLTSDTDIQKLNEKEKDVLLACGLTAKELEAFMHEKLQKKLSAKKIRDRYLGPLEEHGLLSVEKDKENERRNIYYPETLNGQFRLQAMKIEDILERFTLDYFKEQHYELVANSQKISFEYNERKLELEEVYSMITKMPDKTGGN